MSGVVARLLIAPVEDGSAREKLATTTSRRFRSMSDNSSSYAALLLRRFQLALAVSIDIDKCLKASFASTHPKRGQRSHGHWTNVESKYHAVIDGLPTMVEVGFTVPCTRSLLA